MCVLVGRTITRYMLAPHERRDLAQWHTHLKTETIMHENVRGRHIVNDVHSSTRHEHGTVTLKVRHSISLWQPSCL